jgi:hypothetical protein
MNGFVVEMVARDHREELDREGERIHAAERARRSGKTGGILGTGAMGEATATVAPRRRLGRLRFGAVLRALTAARRVAP